jgi:uncharacterized protein (TIGR03435 family)
MRELSDTELLRQYAEDCSEIAFETLVARHVGLVYSAGLRKTGSCDAAEEIAQAVFILLAKKAGALPRGTVVSGWLYQATRLTAANFLRNEIRRAQRQQEISMELQSNQPELWPHLAPLLEDAMGGLNETERNAIVLRFFEEKTFQEIGTALGGSENAAQKRVAYALEKLRKILSKRGVNSTTAIIAGAISGNCVHAVPAGLAQTISTAALAKGAAASLSPLIKGALKIMAWTKAHTAVVASLGILCAATTATVIVKKALVAQRTRALETTSDLSLLDDLPPEAMIFSCPPITPMWSDSRHGKVFQTGATFMALLESAYDVWQSRIIVNVPKPDGKYGFILTYPEMSKNVEGLQTQIEKRFGLEVRREMIETNVLIMTAESPNPRGLKSSTNRFSNQAEPGSITIRDASLFTLVTHLEDNFGTVVIDETGIRGHYDLNLKWDSTPEGLKQALKDQFGFKLTPDRKPVQFVVVDKAK